MPIRGNTLYPFRWHHRVPEGPLFPPTLPPPGPEPPTGPSFPDAPTDGRLYGRRNEAWNPTTEEAPYAGGPYGRQGGVWVPLEFVEEAPEQPYTYGRHLEGWVEVAAEVPPIAPLNKAYGRNRLMWYEVTREAPNDGKQYVRKNEAWAEPDLPPGIPEPPLDATIYGRTGVPTAAPTWTRVCGENLAPFKALRYAGGWWEETISTDAPVDSNLYARRNAGWTECPEETATTGGPYARNYHQWVPTILGPDPPNDGQYYARMGNRTWSPTVQRNPNTGGPYVRRGQDWEAFATPWQTLPPSNPPDWSNHDIQVRIIGGCMLAIKGTLTPFSALDQNPRVVSSLSGGFVPVYSQQILFAAGAGTPGPYAPAAFLINGSGTAGAIQVLALSGTLSNVFSFHILAALT